MLRQQNSIPIAGVMRAAIAAMNQARLALSEFDRYL
jgi:hypothetical protein